MGRKRRLCATCGKPYTGRGQPVLLELKFTHRPGVPLVGWHFPCFQGDEDAVAYMKGKTTAEALILTMERRGPERVTWTDRHGQASTEAV